MHRFYPRLSAALLALTVLAGLVAGPVTGVRAFSEPITAPANPAAKSFDVAWQRTPPVVDGNLNDWSAYQKIILDKTTASYPPANERPEPNDLSAWGSMVWDSDRLYIAVDVTDENIVRSSRNWHFDDMAAFTFDVDNSGSFTLGDIRLTFSPDGLVTDNGGLALGVDSQTTKRSGGWLTEASIPLDQFGSDFLSNAQIGFTWGAQDRDADLGLHYLVWEGETYYASTPAQGAMRFVNGPSRRWITARPGVAGYDGISEGNLNGWEPDTNNGASKIASIRGDQQWHLAMKIVPPALGPGVKPLQARLHMSLVEGIPNPPKPEEGLTTRARLYRLLRPWDEATVTWRMATATASWSKLGADAIGVDRSAQIIAEALLTPQTRTYTWDISSQIQDLYAHPDQNFGFLFRGELGSNVLYQFYSSECTANPTCAPWIEVYIEEPPP